jgi:DNA-binding response OmpR family regulator
MALKSLVVCADDATSGPLREILEAIGLSVEICAGFDDALAHIGAQRYDSVILDCDRETEAFEILRQVRASERNATALAIAIASPHRNVRQMFTLGMNFVLYKPLSEDRVWSSLRAARTLMQREAP